jgi:SAM-dependent methyltransferase
MIRGMFVINNNAEFGDGSLTQDEAYAHRLMSLQSISWKEKLRFLDPYGWQIRWVCKGSVLEVGSGIGRNLRALKGRSLGVDHNETAVAFANQKGLTSLTNEQFISQFGSKFQEFDTILLSHVLEHINQETQDEIFQQYMPFVKPTGRIVIICPQEVGFDSDPTHIRWVDESILINTLEDLNCTKIKLNSFPFPRRFGKKFIYNQFVAIGHLS